MEALYMVTDITGTSDFSTSINWRQNSYINIRIYSTSDIDSHVTTKPSYNTYQSNSSHLPSEWSVAHQ